MSAPAAGGYHHGDLDWMAMGGLMDSDEDEDYEESDEEEIDDFDGEDEGGW
jgi:hypothetical protein